MFDTMTVTKAGGALCGALLIFLMGKWAAESLYHTAPAGHGGEVEQAYSVDTGASEAPDAGEVEGPPFAELLAAADAGAGEKVFGKCKACHKVDGNNGTGPHLDGVVNRDIGSIDGFAYSGTLAELAGDWTPEALDHFLASPKGFAPGTKMGFAGLPKVQDRANVVAYLQSLGG